MDALATSQSMRRIKLHSAAKDMGCFVLLNRQKQCIGLLLIWTTFWYSQLSFNEVKACSGLEVLFGVICCGVGVCYSNCNCKSQFNLIFMGEKHEKV